MEKSTHGGPNRGQGRKAKPPGQKRIKVAITMTPAHHLATTMNRSSIIEQAMDMYFEKKSIERAIDAIHEFGLSANEFKKQLMRISQANEAHYSAEELAEKLKQ